MKEQAFVPTSEQVYATERHLDARGKPYYTCRSASDEESTYTVRWREGHFWPRCNCRDGGLKCWHAQTAQYLEQQEARERLPLNGNRPFQLLK